MAGVWSEETVVYCKNNVSISIRSHEKKDVKGYLTMRTKGSRLSPKASLILHWTPNDKLKSGGSDPNGHAFTVDMGQLRSIRVFLTDGNGAGQFVLTSRQGDFKVLHFPHGGLDQLMRVLDEWPGCSLLPGESKGNPRSDGGKIVFVVRHASIREEDVHPDEGMLSQLTMPMWTDVFDETERIRKPDFVRKVAFFSGVAPPVRPHFWPFLIGFYEMNSTKEEREKVDESRKKEYEKINKERACITDRKGLEHMKTTRDKVEFDVTRTDRTCGYYSGENNPHVDQLSNILLNYAVYNRDLAYTQGMSDLLSPLLAVLDDEVKAFWCFALLMKRNEFFSNPKLALIKNTNLLRDLVKLFLPEFFAYVESVPPASELLFCHRWFLLCFKREFLLNDVHLIWESHWTRYYTNVYHLFVALAIIAVYGSDVVERKMNADESLMHFIHHAKYMHADIVLYQARCYLYQFGRLKSIPCSLKSIVEESLDTWRSEDRSPPTLLCSSDCKHNRRTVTV
ncbi:TBC1 domain family member 16-like isoform X2 [Oscarella lobularis]